MAGTFACPSANSICHKHFTRACPSSGKKRMVCYFYLRKTGLPPKDIRNCPPCEYLIDNSLPAYVAADGGSGAVTPAWSRNYDQTTTLPNGLVTVTSAPSGSGTIALTNTNTSVWVRDSSGCYLWWQSMLLFNCLTTSKIGCLIVDVIDEWLIDFVVIDCGMVSFFGGETGGNWRLHLMSTYLGTFIERI